MEPVTLRIGDRVRFLGRYRIPSSPESAQLPEVAAGTFGTIIRVNEDSVWVEVAGLELPVTVWFEHAFPDAFGKVDLLERVQGSG